jgi:uncharacterized lipoprotein YbaY
MASFAVPTSLADFARGAVVLAFFAAVVAGCAGNGAPSSPPSPPGTGPAVTFRGTAGYREKILLPEETVLETELVDLTRSGIARVVVARSRTRVGGTTPAAFALSVPADVYVATHNYAVDAAFVTGEGAWAKGSAEIRADVETFVLCRR